MKMLQTIRNLILLCAATGLISGCAATSGPRNPQFYPNTHLERVGPSQANADSRYCMSLADDYVKDPSAFQEGLKNTAETAVAGAAAGAVGGAIMNQGRIGRYTAMGAAGGAIVQLLKELEKAGQKSPGWERFVEQCLANKGYQVYSWQ